MGGSSHLAGMSTSGASLNRAPSFAKLRPDAIAVSENPALFKNSSQQDRGIFLDSIEVGDIHSASAHLLKAGRQINSFGISIE